MFIWRPVKEEQEQEHNDNNNESISRHIVYLDCQFSIYWGYVSSYIV